MGLPLPQVIEKIPTALKNLCQSALIRIQYLFRRQSVALVIILLLILLPAGCRPADDSWQRVQESGVLRVGIDPTFPPFANADEGELHGIDVDLARALADELGVEASFVYFGYDGLYDALLTGQADVLISALVVQPERMDDFAYSDSYFNAGEVLVVAAGNNRIGRMEEMAGRRVAVEIGAQGHVEATRWQDRLSDLTILPYNTPDEALEAAARNEADAALVDSVSGRLFLRDNPALEIADDAVTVEPFALVMRIEDEQLLEMLNRSLRQLEAAGQLEAIVNNWLGPG